MCVCCLIHSIIIFFPLLSGTVCYRLSIHCILVCKWCHLFYISPTVRLHPGSTKPLHFITITHYPPASATIPHLHTPAASFSSHTLPAPLSLKHKQPFFRTETLHANMLTRLTTSESRWRQGSVGHLRNVN